MKIGVACTNFKAGGGMERYVLDLVSGFHELGIVPFVFARNFDENLPHYQWINPVRINVAWIPSKLRDFYFSNQLRRLKQNHEIDLLISTARCDCAEMAICGGTHLGYLEKMSKSLTFWDYRQINLEKDFYRNAIQVVAHSGAMFEELRSLYQLDSSKLSCVYPPVSLESFSPLNSLQDKLKLRMSLGLSQNKILFAYPVGGDFYRKGFPYLLEAFSTTNLPIELVIVGKKPKCLSKNMRYLGYRTDMNRIYQACDFTIMPSVYEPFGLIGPESLASGTRVLVSDRVACSEILNKLYCRTFKLREAKSIEKILKEIIQEFGSTTISPLTLDEIEKGFDQVLDQPKSHIEKILNLLR